LSGQSRGPTIVPKNQKKGDALSLGVERLIINGATMLRARRATQASGTVGKGEKGPS